MKDSLSLSETAQNFIVDTTDNINSCLSALRGNKSRMSHSRQDTSQRCRSLR